MKPIRPIYPGDNFLLTALLLAALAVIVAIIAWIA